MVNSGYTNYSSDGDSANKSDAACSRPIGRPRSRKRARGTKDIETLSNACNVEACPPIGPADISGGIEAVFLSDII